MQPYTKSQDTALPILRLVVAAIFINAGASKLMFWSPLPAEMQMSAGTVNLTKFLSIVEPLGGIALIAGFLTGWAATGLAIIMVGAAYIVRFQMHATIFTGMQGSGVDYILLILASCIAIMAFGAGSWSVDGMMKKT